jgi:hypothetical protein
MSKLKYIEKETLEEAFCMGGGYVLDFTNRTFAIFFREQGVDIYSDKYAVNGDSKANRLRTFWEIEPDQVTGRVLREMLEVYMSLSNGKTKEEKDYSYRNLIKIIKRLEGENVAINAEETESDFLKKEFADTSIVNLGIQGPLLQIMENRLKEAERCLKSNCFLSATILIGSILEGILLGVAVDSPQKFNQSACSPKDKTGKVLSFQNWKLCSLIDVANDIGLIQIDVKKFSHTLREFRNFIHPYEQMISNFSINEHTAKICFHVLRAAIADLSGKRRAP